MMASRRSPDFVDSPELVSALQYARERGGTIIMHGYTHQYGAKTNPYDGTSGSDYEFYTAHVDAEKDVRLDGPVPEDSRQWAAERLAVGRGELQVCGPSLPDPAIFEFPHYTASAASYQAVNEAFGVRYDEGTYFSEQCPDGQCSTVRTLQVRPDWFSSTSPIRYATYTAVLSSRRTSEMSRSHSTTTPRAPRRTSSRPRMPSASCATASPAPCSTPSFRCHSWKPWSTESSVEGFHFVSPYEIASGDVQVADESELAPRG